MSMENQNNQNDKPADGYVQAPQQEAKSVLAELAEFVSKESGGTECGYSAVARRSGMQQSMEKEQNGRYQKEEGSAQFLLKQRRKE